MLRHKVAKVAAESIAPVKMIAIGHVLPFDIVDALPVCRVRHDKQMTFIFGRPFLCDVDMAEADVSFVAADLIGPRSSGRVRP